MNKRERYGYRLALRDLAGWVEQHFKLGHQPKIHSASEAEVIYAQILKQIVAHGDDETWQEALVKSSPEPTP